MTKNNHDHRATTLQRVDHLEEWATATDDEVKRLTNGEGYILKELARLRETLRSVEAQLADLSSCLAAHQMDTLGARLKRWWRGQK